MFKLRRPSRHRLFLSSGALVLAALSTCVAVGRGVDSESGTCLRIDHVGESPGLWSGLLATEQWVDATIIRTSQKHLRIGQRVQFGVYIVKGSNLVDKSKAQLNPALIHPGARIRVSPRCQALAERGAIYGPDCLEVGCRTSKR